MTRMKPKKNKGQVLGFPHVMWEPFFSHRKDPAPRKGERAFPIQIRVWKDEKGTNIYWDGRENGVS